jgi:hypothetical protein
MRRSTEIERLGSVLARTAGYEPHSMREYAGEHVCLRL